jgi:hypothetical protein
LCGQVGDNVSVTGGRRETRHVQFGFVCGMEDGTGGRVDADRCVGVEEMRCATGIGDGVEWRSGRTGGEKSTTTR